MSWTAACTLDAAPIGIASARVAGSDAAHSKVAAAASPNINFRIRFPFVWSTFDVMHLVEMSNAARRCYWRRSEQASAEVDLRAMRGPRLADLRQEKKPQVGNVSDLRHICDADAGSPTQRRAAGHAKQLGGQSRRSLGKSRPLSGLSQALV
jgi:hypothetical protein